MVSARVLVLMALVAAVAAQGNLRAYLNDMDFAESQIESLANRVTDTEAMAHRAEVAASVTEKKGAGRRDAELHALHKSAEAALNEIDFDEAAQEKGQVVTTSSGKPAATDAKTEDIKADQQKEQRAKEEASKWKVVSSNWRQDDADKKDDDKKDMELDEHSNNGALFNDLYPKDDLVQETEEYEDGINFTHNTEVTNIAPTELSAPSPQHPSSTYEKNLSKPLAKRPDYSCEICMMVMGRKIADSDELCAGLEHNDDREICWDVVRALVAYDRYTIDWLYHSGCLRKTKSNKWIETIPCPPHVLCSWMMWPSNNIERPFCQFFVTKYKRSEEFHKLHRLPLQAEEADKEEETEKKEEAKEAADGDTDAEKTDGTPTEANTASPGGAPESLDGMIPDASQGEAEGEN